MKEIQEVISKQTYPVFFSIHSLVLFTTKTAKAGWVDVVLFLKLFKTAASFPRILYLPSASLLSPTWS